MATVTLKTERQVIVGKPSFIEWVCGLFFDAAKCGFDVAAAVLFHISAGH